MHNQVDLGNGLCIFVTPLPGARSVTVAAFVRAGSLYEEDRIAGVSHYLEHLLYKGTRRWPTAREVSEIIEGVGGIMNASTDRELTIFWFKVAKPHFQRPVSLLVDMLLNPLLDPAEVEKERQVILEEINMTNDYPSFRSEILIEQALWPDQPMGRDVAGTKASVQAITRPDILDYMGVQYSPSNVVISIAGDVSPEEVAEGLRQSMGRWAPRTALKTFPVEHRNGGQPLRLERRKTDQAHLCIAVHGLPLGHKDRYALDALNVMLGEGMSCRLFLELREKRGLVYDVHSSVSHYRDTGALIVHCGVEPKNAYEATRVILEELHKMTEPVPAEELTKAKELSKGRLYLRLEDSRAVAMWSGAQQALLNKVQTVDEVLGKSAKVTIKDVQRVARQLIAPEKLRMSVVGPFRSEGRFLKLLGA